MQRQLCLHCARPLTCLIRFQTAIHQLYQYAALLVSFNTITRLLAKPRSPYFLINSKIHSAQAAAAQRGSDLLIVFTTMPLLPNLLPRSGPLTSASPSPSNPDAIVIPNGLLQPLPKLNTWFIGFLVVLLVIGTPCIALSAYLIHRWRVDWRKRPERLIGDRAWEVEAFGCSACGREPTKGLIKDGHDGLGICLDIEKLRSMANANEKAEKRGSWQETGTVRKDERGEEQVVMHQLELDLDEAIEKFGGLDQLPALQPMDGDGAPSTPSLPAIAQALPQPEERKTCRQHSLHTSKLSAKDARSKAFNPKRRSWRCSLAGVPEETVPGDVEIGVNQEQRRSWGRSAGASIGVAQ